MSNPFRHPAARRGKVFGGTAAGLALALVAAIAGADSLASDGAAQLQSCKHCAAWQDAWDDPHDLGKHRLDDDVSVRGWRMMRGVYVGHTRNRLGRSGVGVMVNSGEIQYTLNHQGFTVSRRL